MLNRDQFYRITSFTNLVTMNGDNEEAVIEQTLEIESERAAILFISQHIDGVEMIESERRPVDKGRNVLKLKTLRVVHPRIVYENEPVFYELEAGVFASGYAPVSVKERRCFASLDVSTL